MFPARRPASRDTTAFLRPKILPGVEMLRATYTNQRFARHFHECYALGVIDKGALGFRYMGEHVVAPAGAVNLVVPGEPHTGRAETENGWSYRMFYLSPDLLRNVLPGITGKSRSLPHFRTGVIHDPELARNIGGLHDMIECGNTPSMAVEAAFAHLLTLWISRHADDRPAIRRTGRAPKAIARVRDMIRDRYSEDLTSAELAAHAGLSPFHLARTFKKHMGIAPHEYLIQTRIEQARSMLRGNMPIADIALDLGFADQSHFTRHFKRHTGLTPARLRRIVQDG